MIYYVFNHQPFKIANFGDEITLFYPMADPYIRNHHIAKNMSNMVGKRFSIKGVRMVLTLVSLDYSLNDEYPMMRLCMFKENAPNCKIKYIQTLGTSVISPLTKNY